MTLPSVWTIGHILSNEFVIEGILGHGGMGEVFLMRRIVDDRLFAVKTLLAHLIKRQKDRKQFMQELQTWIDLPEHPHLATCRFFRTFEDRLAIFTDPINGGNLSLWLREHGITSIEQIFDIAIQMAWGLHAAHLCGVIHQDVKPANVLMTNDGIAKITDFGLSRSLFRGPSPHINLQPGSMPLVSSAGMTPMYCSPEQANGDRISAKTDIWSWAVSVIELLMEKATWTFGIIAPAILDTIRNGRSRFGLQIPLRLIDILEKALQSKPESRWDDFAQVADELKKAYRDAFLCPYDRKEPEFFMPTGGITAEEGRWRQTGLGRCDPALFIRNILSMTGEDASKFVPPVRSAGSHTSQVMADLALFEDAREMVDRLLGSGRTEFEMEKAKLLNEMAFIHEELGDIPGALDLIEQKIAILESRLQSHAQTITLQSLAVAYMNKANMISDMNRPAESLPIYDAAIALTDSPIFPHPLPAEILKIRAKCQNNIARVYWRLHRIEESEGSYLQAIDVWKVLFRLEKTPEMAHCLAVACMNLGVLLTDLPDRYSKVQSVLNRALRYYAMFKPSDVPPDFPFHVSRVYLAKSNAFFRQEKFRSALKYIDKSMAIRERLVMIDGRRNLAGNLATTYMNKAAICTGMHRYSQALECIDRCIELRSKLVFDENRSEICQGFIDALQEKAFILETTGEIVSAIRFFKESYEMAERFIRQLPTESLHVSRSIAILAIMALDESANAEWTDDDIKGALTQVEADNNPADIKRINDLIERMQIKRRRS